MLKQTGSLTPAPQLHREHGIRPAMFHKWRGKSGGKNTARISSINELQGESWRLKKIYGQLQMLVGVLQEAMKKTGAFSMPGEDQMGDREQGDEYSTYLSSS